MEKTKTYIMKKILLVAMLLGWSVTSYAQNDVTRFLGIPVDGSKYEMIQKLKAKGFTSSPHDRDVLVGEFNGSQVNIYVVTTNNKVSRIMVCDVHTMNGTDIRIRFNKLCQQFGKNPKYIQASSLFSDNTISDDEDISYEITVHKKRYEAAYYQLPTVIDSVAVAEEIQSVVLPKYTEEQLANATEDQQQEIMAEAVLYMLEKFSKKSVWFMISDHYGKYYITMFYDNEYNRANGEDL